MRHAHLLILVCCLLMLSIVSAAEDKPEKPEFAISVHRAVSNDKGTFGNLFVNGEKLCRTLELPVGGGPEGKGPIPAGKFAAHLRYDKPDHWRIQLDDVTDEPAKRTGVQIHIGNSADDTTGCILVGMKADIFAGKLI